MTAAIAIVDGGNSGHRLRRWRGVRVMWVRADKGARASARPARVRMDTTANISIGRLRK
jgi:hypothetical protein